jgi:hypothetical protein
VLEQRRSLVERGAALGPEALGIDERRQLLADARPVRELHGAVWRLEDRDAARRWGLAPAPEPAVPGAATR